MIKVGYLGPKGTFSQEAVKKYITTTKSMDVAGNINVVEYAYITIQDIFKEVRKGGLNEAIVPIENSLEGAVNETLDILAGEGNLKIKSELVIPIRQNLLVKEGSLKKDIKYIISHPQPVGQCRKYISTVFPKAEIKTVYSTAGAAEMVARGRGDSAALGSAIAAKVYNLKIFAKDIQDEDSNFTRFAVISDTDNQQTGNDKTSIVFSTEDKPGSLYRILDIFNLWDINMTRIESRPSKKQLGKYIFFIDIEGHRNDEDVRDALTMVKRKTSFYKFLGSYPKYRFE